MTDNSNASAWQPTEYYGNQPHVRPNYYAFVAFDQAIGPTCQAQVGEYTFGEYPGSYGGRIAAYSIYQDGTLATIVLINSNPANVSETNKPTLTFELSLPTQFAGKDLYLAYLTNDGADAKTGTTFDGVSYEQNDDGTPTRVNNTVAKVTIGDDGSVGVPIRDTQAVVANIGSPVGQRAANKTACSALASTSPDAEPVSSAVGTSTAFSASSSSTHSSAASRTMSSARTSSTSGVAALPTMIFGALASALLSGVYLLWI
jgi:hypothetical protein